MSQEWYQPNSIYLVLINKGLAWTPDESPELDQLQANHLAHIDRLKEEGWLVVAGPIDDGSNLRGITVLRTASLEQAVQMAEADPLVRAGRLAVEVHEWFVPTGVFPEMEA